MTPRDSAKYQVELELLLPTWRGALPTYGPRLAANYFIEDRQESGMGLVINKDLPTTCDLNKAIVDF